jgi:hypothetical protein
MPLGGLIPDSPLIYYGQRYSRYLSRMRGGARRGGAPNVTYSWAVTNVIIYETALARELRAPSGMVWNYMARRGKLALEAAKRQVGVRTGALKMSIHMKHLANATGQYIWIGSNKNYAYIHHEGSRPHLITPSRASTLRFTSGARIIYSRSVLHPGTRPNRYLSSQLKYFYMSL